MDCIFCSIAKGKVPAYKIFEDDKIIAILDIFPATPGHILIFPKEHYEKFEDVPEDVLGRIIVLSKILTKSLIPVLNAKGVNLFLASGEAAGQRSPHILFHLIFRYDNDGLKFEWERKQVEQSIMTEIYKKIVSSLSSTLKVGFPQQIQQNTASENLDSLSKNKQETFDEKQKINKQEENVDTDTFIKNFRKWFFALYGQS